MRGIVAASLVVAVMALAGCTDEPEPRFEEPTETPSASDSTSPAAAEPEPWEEKSKAGAVAFAQIGSSTSTMRLGERRYGGPDEHQFTVRDCADASADRIESLIVGDGGSFETKGWRMLDMSRTVSTASETSSRRSASPRTPSVCERSARRTAETFAATR